MSLEDTIEVIVVGMRGGWNLLRIMPCGGFWYYRWRALGVLLSQYLEDYL
jgi:hypothetical protein